MSFANKNVRIPLPFFSLALVISFILVACSNDPAGPEKEITLPESNLNYVEHIQPLLIVKCGSRSGCHSSFEPARGLDLTNYQILINHEVDGNVRLVIPGQGISSFLYNILREPLLTTTRMPKDEPALSANNQEGIRIWIDEGAQQFP
ncbi:MAG: hypothetical protein E4H13_04440 [Calditrichales bacterium]|nr:MAG: hypothetical protein E4H13_04440 [Calditrichales bacterium]